MFHRFLHHEQSGHNEEEEEVEEEVDDEVEDDVEVEEEEEEVRLRSCNPWRTITRITRLVRYMNKMATAMNKTTAGSHHDKHAIQELQVHV